MFQSDRSNHSFLPLNYSTLVQNPIQQRLNQNPLTHKQQNLQYKSANRSFAFPRSTRSQPIHLE
jgi:hypothetical protein